MVKNKVTYGLEKVHFAQATVDETGNVTYGVVNAIPGAVEITLDPVGDTSKFKADNIDYVVGSSNEGYDGTLKIALLTSEFEQLVLGQSYDTTTGIWTETTEDKQSPFALMFQFEGDKNATRHILYYCSATRPTIASATKDGANYNTTEMKFTAGPRPDNKVVKRKADNPELDSYKNFFTSVYEPTVVPGV